MDAQHEIGDGLAERYCEFLDIIGTIDLENLDRKIERLMKLRVIVARIQANDTLEGWKKETPKIVSVDQVPATIVQPTKKKRGDGLLMVLQALDAGPMRQIEIAKLTGLSQPYISLIMKENPILFRRLDGKDSVQKRAWEMTDEGEGKLTELESTIVTRSAS
jgi:hypothetical protein